jgi:hypothetical protein
MVLVIFLIEVVAFIFCFIIFVFAILTLVRDLFFNVSIDKVYNSQQAK